VWQELGALTKSGRSLRGGLSTVVTPDMYRTCLNGAHSLSGYVRLAVWHVTGRLTCPMPLLYNQVQYELGIGWSYVEKPAETIRLESGKPAI